MSGATRALARGVTDIGVGSGALLGLARIGSHRLEHRPSSPVKVTNRQPRKAGNPRRMLPNLHSAIMEWIQIPSTYSVRSLLKLSNRSWWSSIRQLVDEPAETKHKPYAMQDDEWQQDWLIQNVHFRPTSKMSHDHSRRDSCRNRLSRREFHSEMD